MIIKVVREFIISNKQNFINSFYYLGGSFVMLLVSFFSQPIYARFLTAKDFGILGYYTSISSFFTPLFLFGMTQFYLMNYFRQKTEENKILLFNILVNLSLFNIFFSLGGFIIVKFAFHFNTITVPFFPYSLYIFFVLYFNTFIAFLLITFRVTKKGKSFFFISAIIPILNVLFGLFFVIKFNMGADGKMLGQVVTNVLVGLISIIILGKHVTIKFKPSLIRKSLKYVLPLIGAGYAYYPIKSIDKLYLERLDDISELGYYNIGFTAANFISMACVALLFAFEPDIYKAVSNNNLKKVKKLGGIYMGVVFLIIIVFISLAPYLLDFLTSGRYTRAYKYANLFAVGILFMQLFVFLNTIIIASKKTKISLLNNIIGSISAIIAYKIFISYYSFLGANIAFISVAFVMAISSLIFIIYLFNKKEIV